MQQKPVILFDGVCNLCNSSVQFIIRHDNKNIFLFAPLQSKSAATLLSAHQFNPKDLQTIVLLENDKIYTRSTAALRIARQMTGWPKWLYGLIIVPVPLRDAVYGWIANNRYKWFSKKEACMVPSPEIKSKFLIE